MADKKAAKGWTGRVAGTRKTTPGFRLVEKHAMLGESESDGATRNVPVIMTPERNDRGQAMQFFSWKAFFIELNNFPALRNCSRRL